MPRFAQKPIAMLARFVRARRGATAVEFALVAAPLLILIFGVIELCMILLVSATLDTATDFAARNIRTGVFQKSGAITNADFAALVCRNMNWLSGTCDKVAPQGALQADPTGTLFVEAQIFPNFAAAAQPRVVDIATFDPQQVCWEAGNPGDIVLVRTYYRWPIISPLLRPFFQNATIEGQAGRLIETARLFRNEPFDPSLQPIGDGPCG
jgi:Flp pilus assembly protein TadG